ncbi:glutathione S-transferase domain-containing protein [Schizosaccharomyces cryophilus OY26]|uniref:Glutathione S-transferase domain-containing protein n=1 Tax=Schizosaccharomyces cryophilus (strain OY26 / ATCC MYA-4695 / CBS 11777 / NBRC 106824 / NRRL Y48691) TaxID=653667 RepID=S9VPN8_SCHCR|nr:glutathione S-transferase domain-containing protein [Schizosaccharomyces cryophilus OY26]EPY49898.1 glutathione S-transferase domain-containing protein [Schizosaccharomyces cryophilus OY26]
MGEKMKLYGFEVSGHVHRVRLLLSFLKIPFEWIITQYADMNSEEIKQLNPWKQVPILKDGDIVISDSNAIMVYLVKKYGNEDFWLLKDPLASSWVQRWFSYSAGELRYGPSTARRIQLYKTNEDSEAPKQIAAKLFKFMNDYLEGKEYLVNDHITLADLAMYSYTSHAPEGHISLQPYPNIVSWLKRIESLPEYVPLKWSYPSMKDY